MTAISVSYTHLDVYKRQAYKRVERAIKQQQRQQARTPTMVDVYKRQIQYIV